MASDKGRDDAKNELKGVERDEGRDEGDDDEGEAPTVTRVPSKSLSQQQLRYSRDVTTRRHQATRKSRESHAKTTCMSGFTLFNLRQNFL